MSSPTPPPPTPPIPATALSRFNNDTFQLTQLAIGQNQMIASFNPATPMYWYVVVDLTNLSVVAQASLESETEVPQEILQYFGKPGYFLFVVGNALNGYNIPQGELYSFLRQIGAGPALTELEQMIGQLGTGMIVNFSYILAATTQTNDAVGFEAFSVTNFSVLTMQFLPVYVNGSWVYAPIQSAVATPA